MRKLDRDLTPPMGLEQYQHGRDTWGKNNVPSKLVYIAIWDKLNAMQGQRCAYCEGPIDKKNRHIEHFYQRNRHPRGTFDWSNLFGSCKQDKRCGRHKDSYGDYNFKDLIKPDNENPDDLLVFAKDGTVHPRRGLSPKEQDRAQKTIAILNLNHPQLKAIRREAVRGYIQTVEDIAAFAADPQYSEGDWQPLLEEEIQETQSKPYATAIRHVLTRQD